MTAADGWCRMCQAATLAAHRGCAPCNLQAIAAGLRATAEQLEIEATHAILNARRGQSRDSSDHGARPR